MCSLKQHLNQTMATDIFTPAERSAVMAAVKSTDTKPERIVRKTLHRLGYRYRLHVKTLPGAPDLVFPARRAVIFVHGCFWHGHDCARGARVPKANRAYWINKIDRNRDRDHDHRLRLERWGWRSCIIWECALRSSEWIDEAVAFLESHAHETRRSLRTPH